MAGEAMGSEPLCRGLKLLKRNLGGLNVDEELLDIMQERSCLTPTHAESLLKMPESDRLNSMMCCFQRRPPAKWGLLVCVFLKTRHDQMAKSSWHAVREHLGVLQVRGEHKEALDLWATFVRQMLVLVQDQETLGLEVDEQRKTASDIWEEMLKEAAGKDELNMWKLVVSSVTVMLKDSEPDLEKTKRLTENIWKSLVSSVQTSMERGGGEKAVRMYKCLVQKANAVAFSKVLLESILKIMVEFMVNVQKSNQQHLIDDVRGVLVEHLRVLFALDRTSGLPQWEAADYLFNSLIDSLQDLLRMEKPGEDKAGDLWKDLVDVQQHLQASDTHGERLNRALYRAIYLLIKKELADKRYLEDLRAMLSSGARSKEPQPCSTADANDNNVPSPSAQLNVPRIESYSTSQYDNLALVINNVDFNEEAPLRAGSEMDELALSGLLKRMGFHVQEETNLTKKELYRAIAIFAERPEHASAGMTVLAVMTHGANEALLGTDKEELSFQEVIDCFSNETAPYLVGKPKWLCLQACRKKSDETKRSEAKTKRDSRVQVADMFITYTALRNFAALRDETQGTLYVQALKDVLDLSQAQTLSLFELHVKVQEFMTDMWKMKMGSGSQSEVKGPEPKLEIRTLGWKKKLFFNQRAI